MAKRNYRRRRAPRQNWHPNFLLRIINRVWRIAFSAVKVAAGAVATVFLIGIVCGFVFVTLLGQYLQDDIIPMAEINLDNYDMEKTSYIYYKDENGNYQILQQLATTMDRRWVEFEDIPEELVQAAIAIEDKRFYEHQGVDWITTMKACINMFFGSGSQFGGSTLTQQLVKNILLMDDENADDVTVQRKILEIFRALQFEKTYSKEVVIEYYMNTVYFGSSCYGVKSAAEHYFGKELQDMNTAEFAALIGITNNPSMYNPYSQKVYEHEGEERDGAGRNAYRQKVVLTQMYVQGWLTEAEYYDAYGYELVYKSGIDDQDRWNTCKGELDSTGNVISEGCGYEGPVRDLVAVPDDPDKENSAVTYYCPDCGSKIDVTVDASLGVYSWYVDTVLEDVAKALAAQDGVEWGSRATREHYMNLICRSGYHIYTPYNAEVQAAVDKIYTDMNEIPEVKNSSKLNSAIVIIDNKTGDIVAMAGDTGLKTVSDATNHATDDPKQIGSSIKPLTVYAPAFDAGLITPATIVDDLPLYYTGENNTNPYPQNYDNLYRCYRTVWRGIINSYNTIASNVLEMMGTKYSYNFGKDMLGLSNLVENRVTSSGRVLSDIGIAALAMGGLTDGLTVRDVTTAYATFANNGVYREARTFTLILDDQGKVVMKNEQESRRVLSEKAVGYMNYCLDSAVASGTGTSADMYKELGMDVAGKTGTTNSNKDLYFAGYTGYYTAAVWSGFKVPEKIVLSGSTVSPSTRLWKKVMLQIHQGLETIPLYDSDAMETVTICLESGKLATEACKNDIRTDGSVKRYETVRVYPEDAPTQLCDKHINVDYCTSGNGVANEYCHKFHNVGAAVLTEKALVKITQARLDEMHKLNKKYLASFFRGNEYIYLVDEAGYPQDFFGINGDINQGLHVPYQVCTKHTLESWEAYKKDHPWIDGGTVEPEPEPDPNPDPNPEPNPEPEPDPNPDLNPGDGNVPQPGPAPDEGGGILGRIGGFIDGIFNRTN